MGLGGIPNDLGDMFDLAAANGSRVHTNSWGSSVAGYYTTKSMQSDMSALEHDNLVIMFAAANEGIDGDGDGEIDLDSMGSPATAKNVISIGASENLRSNATGSWPAWASNNISGMATFSSRGPTDDNRLKPDFSAPGTNILSTKSRYSSGSGDYQFMSGTSMATPVSAGATALLLQHLIDNLNHSNPSSALVKGIFATSAVDMMGQYNDVTNGAGETAPNNHEGWGRIHLLDAASASFVDRESLSTGEERGWSISVPNAAPTMQIMLSYNDATSSPIVSANLVNDVDLSIKDPSGTWTNLSDSINNLKGLTFTSPAQGVWEIHVLGTSVASGPQFFSVAVNSGYLMVNLTQDADFDGTVDENDQCAFTFGISIHDRQGCPDSDGDGYSDPASNWTIAQGADAFITEITQWADQDGDGYGDNANGNTPDLCPNTPAGQVVDATGCSDTEIDDDSDGVPNSNDACPSTPAGETVNTNGCSDTELDGDLDGIKDAYDACPSTSLGLTVDAAGCADSQRDGDNDGLSDDVDQCPSTPAGSPVDGYGCSSEQRDNDNDGVYDSADLCGLTEAGATVDQDGCADAQKDDDGDGVKNDVDLCPGTEPVSVIDVNGCSDSQLDDDQDQIFNNIDVCPATPIGEMPNSEGCSASQLDDDMDTVNNADDLCPMTDVNPSLDVDGCVASQRDTDLDGVTDKDDDCPNTNSTSISDDDGCALEQLDSDNDGVNDLEDDFPLDALESKDTDGDGVPDRQDAYPGDATKTKAEVEEEGTGMWVWTAVAVLVLGILAGLGMMKRSSEMIEKVSPFTQQVTQQGQEETQLLQEAPAERQEWEENGVKWSRSPEGTLYYYDAQSEQWIEYQQ